MRNIWRAGVFAVCLGVCTSACNGGSGQGGVIIVVDGQGLTQAQLDSVRSVWIYIDGDTDAGRVTLEFPMMGLKGGTYSTTYHPKSHAGVLTITGVLEDAMGAPIAMSSTTVDIKMGNQVMATIMLVGSSSITEIDAGTGADVPVVCAAATCDALVSDGCCPTGCTPATDLDCATCGNGILDPGEACDPLSTCPTACPQTGCQLFSLTNAGTCQAACTASAIQTMCVNGDGCCPNGCNSVTDSDCAATCGNHVVDGAEICDGDCPTSCPPRGCQLRTLAGSAATCDAKCVNAAMQTGCAGGDGCCPSGCTSATDSDCAVTCGNGILDPGETCDGNCPTACPAAPGCQLQMLTGSAATCDAKCVAGPMQTACMNKDGCCPAGCNTSNDTDCVAACRNGVLEGAETCEIAPASPLCAAITCDDNNACTTDSRLGTDAACNVACAHSDIITCSLVKDGCCPTKSLIGCNATNDADCGAVCGNGIVEKPTESCDTGLKGSCPTTCPQAACVLPVLVNPGTCIAACVDQGKRQTSCVLAAKDGCCPGGCNATTDADCVPACGNGVLEAGETCEVAPAATLCTTFSCDDKNACTTDTKTGTNAACNLACVHTAVTTCSLTKDGCCPAGCNATNDADCGAVCGNGVIETGETCETKMPATPLCASVSCNDLNACTTDAMTGSAATCNIACVHTNTTACSLVKDGCCPMGCNSVSDGDCPTVCGNGLLEAGETCDVAPASPACTAISCDDKVACTKDTTTGSPAMCNVACTHTAITACVDGDGCCPSICTGLNDSDCAPTNDTCAAALDISAGGDFPFSLYNAKQDLTGINCPVVGMGTGPFGDVFFKFTLPTNPAGVAALLYYGYFDVFDPAGKAVNVSLELYQAACPVDAGNPAACADPSSGKTACNTAQTWPRMMPANNLTGGISYTLVARVANNLPGRYTLRFHRVPASCAAAGLLATDGVTTGVSTCNNPVDLYGPFSCTAATVVGELNYYLVKCPAPGLTVDTCSAATGQSDTVVQVSRGSVDFNFSTFKCTVMSTAMQVCDDTNTNPACGNKTSAAVTNVERGERGIFTVNLGSINKCSNVGLTTSLVP